MKKIVLTVFALIAVAFVFTACDKDEQVIPNEQLPEAATAFVNEYFAGAKIISSIKDKEGSTHEYEVKLDNGVDIKFDNNGNWLDVEARNDTQALPNTGFILSSIVSYVSQHYASAAINGIEKKPNGFDVELTNDMDLVFDVDGVFVRVDN